MNRKHKSSTRKQPARFARPALMAIILATSTIFSANAQEKTQPAAEPVPHEIQYAPAPEKIWEFGLQISCTGGMANKCVASFPVPIDWPEQSVELFEETKTDNIKKVSFKTLNRSARFASFRVVRLGPGEIAEVILRYRVTRNSTLPPETTDGFTFATKMKGRTKSWLKPSPFIECKDKKIVSIGKDLDDQTNELTDWKQVEAIYSWVRDNVEYKFDETQHSCLDALATGHGDCEELSSLFIAICRSRGIPARAVWVPGHTYPEFYLADESGTGHWFPCQAAGALHEFGEMNEFRPILQKGDRFKLPGKGGKVERYVKPTLYSPDATGELKIDRWIIREAVAK